jgi:tRNA-modifying protein YgfZ
MTGYEALRSAVAWFDVSGRGKIRVTGEDNARLLHAMSTNDLKNLAEGAGRYAFFLTDKGRIVADAYIYHRPDGFLLDTEPETAAILRDHLDRYIIADDAALEDDTATLAAIALEGPTSFAAAATLGLPVPAEVFGTVSWQDGFIARVSVTGAPGLRMFLPTAMKVAFLERLKVAEIPEAAEVEVRVVRLEHGTPRFGEDISSRYLAQETQIAHAVHANKGCYLGQEIVERVRAQGQVHRLLAPLRITATEPPPAGTKLLANGSPAAEITSAAYSPALGEVVALAYVRREALHNKPTLVVADSSPEIVARLFDAIDPFIAGKPAVRSPVELLNT